LIKISRRSLLAGFAVCAAASAAPALATRFDYPTLYGDGVRDDTAGLQALIDGKPVYLADGSLHSPTNHIRAGSYTINEPLSFTVTGSGLRFKGKGVTINRG